MPRQEHLSQTGGQLTDRGGVRSPRRGPVVLIILLLALQAAAAHAGTPLRFTHALAARGGWTASAPPATGWTPVALPDNWYRRWPGHDGVVWYRLAWRQAGPPRPMAMTLPWARMAAVVSVNGTEVSRNGPLVDRLSRAANSPSYLFLPAPLLRAGDNDLVIRVSGQAAYNGGLSVVTLGEPADIWPLFQREQLIRQVLSVAGLGGSLALACVFATVWMLRRRDSIYGWFAFCALCRSMQSLALVPSGTWPFASMADFQVAMSIVLLVNVAAYITFALRFFDRRAPRVETALWVFVALGAGSLMVCPPSLFHAAHDALTFPAVLAGLGVWVWSAQAAWRGGRAEQKAFVALGTISAFTDAHDILELVGVFHDQLYLFAFASMFRLAGAAFVLAWRFVGNLERIEAFNVELRRNVEEARAELTRVLGLQHAREVIDARLGERLMVAHDLHDGLGGIIVSKIAALEHAPDSLSPTTFLSILKELREDLRLIIDTTSGEHQAEASLAQLIAPLRHRFSQAFEAKGVDCHWRLGGLDRPHLGPALNLDLMRLLQESLTNVVKHSQARRVDILLEDDGGTLTVEILDDGVGFDVATAREAGGAGLRSLNARARRLGGVLDIRSSPGSTLVRFTGLRTEPAAAAANG